MNILEFISVGMFRHFLWVLFLMTCVETEATPAAPLDTDYTGVTGVSIIPPGHLLRSLLYPLSLSLSLATFRLCSCLFLLFCIPSDPDSHPDPDSLILIGG